MSTTTKAGATALGCKYHAPTFGARYPDGTCIDGYMWDLDSGDGDMLDCGGDEPCPWCNTAEHVDRMDARISGSSHQRRIARRLLIKKVRAWAEKRSSFHPATGAAPWHSAAQGAAP